MKGFAPYKNLSKEIATKTQNQDRIVIKLTENIIQTYKACDKNFNYDLSLNPQRTLTQPSEGVLNDGYDNSESDYILKVNDKIISYNQDKTIKNQFIILDLLGKGTFGQVVKCKIQTTNQLCAIKIIKNRPAYFNQGKMEICILKLLKEKKEKENQNDLNFCNRVVWIQDYFMFHKHLVIAFELLDGSLLDLLEAENFEGFSLSQISKFTKQILEGLIFIEELKIIHCDLKPENILFIPNKLNELKIIDFGSACHQQNRIYSYIQTRFYRAPEVLIGYKYNASIDIWSLGCICVEMYLGYPIFPGNSQYDQLSRIIEILGLPPQEQIEESQKKSLYFKQVDGKYEFKTRSEFEETTKETLKPSTIFFSKLQELDDLIVYYSESKFRQSKQLEDEIQNFPIFLDFLKGLINIDPQVRWPASKAVLHPFIQQGENLDIKINVPLPFNFENQQNEQMKQNETEKDHLQKIKIKQRDIRETNSLTDYSENLQQDFSFNAPYLNNQNQFQQPQQNQQFIPQQQQFINKQ